MNSAFPQDTASFGSDAKTRSSPARDATHSDVPRRYEMVLPSGERRTSKTPDSIDGIVTSPLRRSISTMLPPRTVTASVTSRLHAYDVMPLAPSRARSRCRSSAAVSSDKSVLSVCGSSSSRSTPVAVSRLHNVFTESDPECERMKMTREPSGDTVKLRGSPSESRCVRAYWRGNVSLTRAEYLTRRHEPCGRPIH